MKANASINRRRLLKSAAVAVTAAGVLELKRPFVVTARAQEAIKLGVLLPKSGPYTVRARRATTVRRLPWTISTARKSTLGRLTHCTGGGTAPALL